jgi:hypothetical protein
MSSIEMCSEPEVVERGPALESVDPELLGVFAPNKKAPIHRWVTFTEGFSAQLVAQELASVSPDAFVFDPFGGTGTTPLMAAQLGHPAAWAEVNPYLQEVALTKIAAVCAGPIAREAAEAELLEALLSGSRLEVDGDHPMVKVNASRDFFPPGSAEHLVSWVRRFEACESDLARKLGRLAVASSTIAVSNMRRAVDLRRRTIAELQQVNTNVDGAVRERVMRVIDDLRVVPVAPGSAILASADARALPSDLPQIDVVITSPPYLNGTNYCRNTKLELLLLKYIDSEAELGELRSRAVTAGINNVSRRMREPDDLPEVRSVAAELDERGYDRRIGTMVRAYFSDMKVVLSALRAKMASNGKLVLDIGDSRFAGIHVDTPALLAQVAEGLGWRVEVERTIRGRTAKDGGRLCQKLLYLCLS